jgi:murein L,D-transpeptidase YcbB/YkuD
MFLQKPRSPHPRHAATVTMHNLFFASILSFLLFMATPARAADSLLWFAGGRPNGEALQALHILSDAASEGLNPENYGARTLSQAFEDAGNGPSLPAEAMARLDRSLTEAMERYLTHLHFGQVDPRLVEMNFSAPRTVGYDPAAVLREAVRDKRLREAVAEAAPDLPLYRDLRRALDDFRKFADESADSPLWRSDLPPVPNRKLEPGQSYAGLPLLIQRLVSLGDLPVDTFVSSHYDGAVVDGVKAFQARHGLEPDGIVGAQTLSWLNVRPGSRVRQIELAMERLRWTPLLAARSMVVVNVPENVLEAYEVRDGRIEVKARMRVITGNAAKTRTPLFDQEMRSIEFNPYWNVPSSIARKEVVPELRKYPHYFDRQGFEFVSGDGSVTTEFSFAALDAVMRGQMRIRQRPGPKNAMGDIKFVMPNKDNIYLHHTGAPRLFERYRRDLSHGCVRVEDPVALARFVLRNDPDWSEERIRSIMETGQSTTIRLREPVRVVIAYNTVRVENDAVHFFSDVYGQDSQLERMLRGSGDRLN